MYMIMFKNRSQIWGITLRDLKENEIGVSMVEMWRKGQKDIIRKWWMSKYRTVIQASSQLDKP